MGRWSLISAETKAPAVFSDCGGFVRAGVRLALVGVSVFVVFVLVALMGVVDVARLVTVVLVGVALVGAVGVIVSVMLVAVAFVEIVDVAGLVAVVLVIVTLVDIVVLPKITPLYWWFLSFYQKFRTASTLDCFATPQRQLNPGATGLTSWRNPSFRRR